MTLTNILEAPEMRHTLAALPDDPQLAALRAAWAAQHERLAAVRARPIAIRASIAIGRARTGRRRRADAPGAPRRAGPLT